MLPAVLAGGVQPYVAERLICTTSDSMLWHYNVEAALVHVPKQVWPCQPCAPWVITPARSAAALGCATLGILFSQGSHELSSGTVSTLGFKGNWIVAADSIGLRCIRPPPLRTPTPALSPQCIVGATTNAMRRACWRARPDR